MKVTKRDKFSGHWWIQCGELSIEAYRGRAYDWGLCDVRHGGISLLSYVRLDRKRNLVDACLCGRVVPGFATLRSMITWVDHIMNGIDLAQL